MKTIKCKNMRLLPLLLSLLTALNLSAKEYDVHGPQGGKFFNARFDPKDPPEFIRCWGFMKLGREYLLSTQELDIYGTASAYKGDVLILHGTKDSIVPLWCSERYKETYGSRAELVLVDGENHTITRRRAEVVRQVVRFFGESK